MKQGRFYDLAAEAEPLFSPRQIKKRQGLGQI